MKRCAAIGVAVIALVLWVVLSPAGAQLTPGRTATAILSPPMPASTVAQELPVAFPKGSMGPFGDILVAELTPTFQADFVYGINAQLGTTAVASTGVVDATPTLGLRVQTGVTGGTVLQNFVATNATSYALDLTPFNIFVGPGETLTVSGAATNSGQVGVGLTWDEGN